MPPCSGFTARYIQRLRSPELSSLPFPLDHFDCSPDSGTEKSCIQNVTACPTAHRGGVLTNGRDIAQHAAPHVSTLGVSARISKGEYHAAATRFRQVLPLMGRIANHPLTNKYARIQKQPPTADSEAQRRASYTGGRCQKLRFPNPHGRAESRHSQKHHGWETLHRVRMSALGAVKD